VSPICIRDHEDQEHDQDDLQRAGAAGRQLVESGAQIGDLAVGQAFDASLGIGRVHAQAGQRIPHLPATEAFHQHRTLGVRVRCMQQRPGIEHARHQRGGRKQGQQQREQKGQGLRGLGVCLH